MSTQKLFHSIVGYGIALTAVIESGAACSRRPPMREGPPPARCTAANPCGLSGQVVDETGAPIAGASVTMGREVVTTDEGGQFSLRGDDGLAATVEATTPDGRRGHARVGGEGDSVTIRIEGLPPPPQTPPEPPQPQPVT